MISMVSLSDFPELEVSFPEIKALESDSRVREIVVYGGIGRGNKETQDGDFLIFTDGKRYETPLSVFYNLLNNEVDPTKTDVQILCEEELDGVLCRLFKPSSYNHVVNNGKLIFSRGGNSIEKLKSRKNIWYDISNKTGIKTHYLLELSEESTSIRGGFLWIGKFMPKRKRLGKDSRISFIKTLNGIKGTAIPREGLALKDIFLGKHDESKNIWNRFYDEYSLVEKDREKALEISDFDPRKHEKFTNDELRNIVEKAKKIGEHAIYAINEEIEGLISSFS